MIPIYQYGFCAIICIVNILPSFIHSFLNNICIALVMNGRGSCILSLMTSLFYVFASLIIIDLVSIFLALYIHYLKNGTEL